jgi:hypothetical protein
VCVYAHTHTLVYIVIFVVCLCEYVATCVVMCMVMCVGRGASAGTGAAMSIKDVMDQQASSQKCAYCRSLLPL